MSFDYVEEMEMNKNQKNKKRSSKKGKLIENTNVMMPSTDEIYELSESDHSDDWGIPRMHKPKDIYCGVCAGNHNEKDC